MHEPVGEGSFATLLIGANGTVYTSKVNLDYCELRQTWILATYSQPQTKFTEE
jgi:hypothetical protein